MKLFKQATTLSPWPKIYSSWNPILVGTLGLAGLWGILHLIQVMDGKPFLSGDAAFEIGDPILALYMGLTAVALKGHSQENRYFYHSRYWYVVVGIMAIVINIMLMYFGLTKLDTFSLLAIAHFVLVPIYAVLVAGVLPLLLFGVEGHRVTRLAAATSVATYLATLMIALGP